MLSHGTHSIGAARRGGTVKMRGFLRCGERGKMWRLAMALLTSLSDER